MTRAIDTRKEDLMKHLAGAVTYAEPKWLWVKMIDRVGVIDKSLALHGKFNHALENMLVGCKAHYLIDINKSMHDTVFFNPATKIAP